MMLADMGADVVRIDRPTVDRADLYDVTTRGKRSVSIDLKSAEGRETARQIASRADMLIEGFRPGVMEKMGLGPDELLAINPRLIFGRMTGWGQDGPLSRVAGHDINYISLSGALGAIRAKTGEPVIPLNLIGDYAGGTMFLLYGLLCALNERHRSGKGQVVDAAMIDGVAMLFSPLLEMHARCQTARPESDPDFMDGRAPF